MDCTPTQSRYLRLLAALGVPLIVGALGGLAASSPLSNWYPGLFRPAWTPPNWVFAPVWTVLFLVMGFAAWRIWNLGPEHRPVRTGLVLFGIQLMLNLGWSMLFFSVQNPLMGLVDLVILDTVLLITMIALLRIDRIAGYLLAPYLLWIWFATSLNAANWWMNRA